jgi:hypothetical protein
VHCQAHSLQLALEAASSRLPDVADYFNYIQHISKFVEGSAKRHAIFTKIQKESSVERVKALALIGATRWNSRRNTIKAIDQTFSHIIEFMKVFEMR